MILNKFLNGKVGVTEELFGVIRKNWNDTEKIIMALRKDDTQESRMYHFCLFFANMLIVTHVKAKIVDFDSSDLRF